MIETIDAQARNLLWIALLIYGYRQAPRILPDAGRLARIAIGCASPMPLVLGYHRLAGIRGYSLGQGVLTTILDAAAFVGMIAAIACGGIAIILDTKRRPQ